MVNQFSDDDDGVRGGEREAFIALEIQEPCASAAAGAHYLFMRILHSEIPIVVSNFSRGRPPKYIFLDCGLNQHRIIRQFLFCGSKNQLRPLSALEVVQVNFWSRPRRKWSRV